METLHRNKVKKGFEELPDYIPEDEPVKIHTICRKCGERIVLPEKVWLKRGSICGDCYRGTYDCEED